jgi:phosphoribosylanthranilate isomerase
MTRVKVCGIRRIEDASLAVELGASALGFIFWPSSPRFVEPDRARDIVASLPAFVGTVGVFVDQPPDFVADVARALKLSLVQLHGREAVDEYLRRGLRVVKAVAVGPDTAAENAVLHLPDEVGVLLDAHDPIRRGGTGQTIDWEQAGRLARTRAVILSGGLNADNVGTAIATVRPHAVDVSSGVESRPGVKDEDKLRAFFTAVESAREAVNRGSN